MTRKLLKIALVVLLSVVSISIDAQEKPVLWYDKPARYWEEALPLGNGRLGAMVYGNPVTEEIQLNEETVSAGSPYKNYNPEAKGALATIRQLIFAGRYPEAQALAGEKILSKNGFGMPYQTVGSLRLDFPSHENYTNFRRELDLEKAVATTAYTVNGIDYKREVFTSFVDQLVIVRLTASQPGKLTFSASLTCPQKVDVTVSGKNALILEGTTKGDDFTKGSICFRSLRSAPSVQVGTAPVCRKMSEFPPFSVRHPVSAGSLRTLLFDSGRQADALHRTRGVVGDKYQSLRPKTVIPPRRIECHHDFARLAGFDPLSAAKRTSDTFRSFYGPDYQGRFAVITKCQRSLCRSSCPFHGAKINNIFVHLPLWGVFLFLPAGIVHGKAVQKDVGPCRTTVDTDREQLFQCAVTGFVRRQVVAEGKDSSFVRSDPAGIVRLKKSARLFGSQLQGQGFVRKVGISDGSDRSSPVINIGESVEIVFESQSVAAVDGVELFEGLRATDDGTRNAQFGGDAAVGRKDGQFPRKVAGAVGRIVSYRDFGLLARENRFARISGSGATAGRSDLEDYFGVFPFVAADETMRNRAVGFADGAEIPCGPVEYQSGLSQTRQCVHNQGESQ